MTNPFQIDEAHLATEWLNQPMLFKQYADQLADARRAVDIAEAKAKMTYADLDHEIRTNPGDFDLIKVSEAVVENTIWRQPNYRAVVKSLVTAKHAMRLLDSAVKSMEHKKRALEKLVDLQGRNYWSAPNAAPSGATLTAAEKKTAARLSQRKR